MFKKLIPLAIIAILFMFGCGKYSDVKSVIKDIVKVTDTCTAELQKAQNGKDAAVAIEAYTTKMSVLRPKMNEYFEKYPELKTTKPTELEKIMQEYAACNNKFFPVFNETIMKFKGDADLNAAMENLQNMRKQSPFKRY